LLPRIDVVNMFILFCCIAFLMFLNRPQRYGFFLKLFNSKIDIFESNVLSMKLYTMYIRFGIAKLYAS
jgi:hypothetical protein